MQADGNTGAGGVDQADCLVRQLPRRDVAFGQEHGGFQRRIKNVYLVVILQGFGKATQHQQGSRLVGLIHLYDLETPGQRRVFFDVLLVLGKRRGAHRAQGATGQCRFE